MKSSESTITCGFRFNGAGVSVGIAVGVAGRGVKVSVMEIAVTVGGSGVDEAMSGAYGDATHAETVSMHKTNKKILIGVINLIEPSLLRLGLSS